MRIVYCLLIFLFYSSLTNAQCVANAGPDKHSCPDDTDAYFIPIGGNPSAFNGTPPYTYSWTISPNPIELFFTGSGIFLYASDILDDTTSANPHVVERHAAASITFYLTITDALGCTAVDSCRVSFTTFYYNLINVGWNINPGDSVFLNEFPNVGVDLGPLTYYWQPSHGLSDTTLASGFWAKPDSSIAYYVTVTDSLGCQTTGEPMYFIDVSTVGLDNYEEIPFDIFPNPSTGIFTLSSLEPIDEINVFDLSGKLLMQKKAFANCSELDFSGFESGMYLIQVRTAEQLSTVKVVKE